jgi:single-strand DNA-binding protein
MATSSNSVTIVGNITRDPELRFTPSGQATATFGVAVNRSWQDRQSQEWKEQTSFFDVVCWRELAENAAQSLTRGTRVVVTGRLEQRSWETQDGDKRSKVEIVADDVAPSLRWASAAVTRNERRGPDAGSDSGAGNGGGYSNGGGNGSGYSNGGGYNGGGGGGYAPQAAPARPVPAQATAPAAGDGADYPYADEEPF